MSVRKPTQVTGLTIADPGWSGLYKIAGASALFMAMIIPIQSILFAACSPPLNGSVLDWFTLFQEDWLLGLLSFEFLMIVYTILSLPVALALYAALRGIDHSLSAIFLVLSVVGVVLFVTARPVFEMLSLSSQYAAATTDAQRTVFLSSGQMMLALFNGTAFHVNYVVGSISGLIISIVMLRSATFSKTTAYVRILSSVLDFGLFVPTIGLYISLFSVVFLLVWNILVAKRLIELARH